MLQWKERYVFSENFPYFNTPGDVEYEKFRDKFIIDTGSSTGVNGQEKWLLDTELMILIHKELGKYQSLRHCKSFYNFSLRIDEEAR